MIHNLSGALTLKSGNLFVIDVCGVGYKIFASPNTISKLGDIKSEVRIFTHMHVREDEISLFGFLTMGELEFFEKLISISGIGPKSAMAIMSIATVERLAAAISHGEIELLQKVSGIGRKTAERITLELKDKMKTLAGDGSGDILKTIESDADVYEALTGMGYSAKQAKDALSKIGKNAKNTNERLKEALRIIKN